VGGVQVLQKGFHACDGFLGGKTLTKNKNPDQRKLKLKFNSWTGFS
jgi:hypothetical protein